jgi:hypothetical protein
MDALLTNKWILWYHHEKDNWKLSGFKQLYTISTIKEFWKFYNNWAVIGGITNKHIFLMKEGITPLWEDKENITGGCWSFKIHEDNAEELWEDLSVYLISDKLYTNDKDTILGLSFCLKKNNNVVIKIWNKLSKYNSIKLLSNNILEKWGTDIIYIAHMPSN